MNLRAIGAAAAAILLPVSAFADTVDNPGAVTFTVQAGSSVTVGVQAPISFGGGIPASTLTGTVAADGTLSLPNLTFQPIAIPGFAGYTAQIVQDSAATGAIDPVNGTATASVTAHVKISGSLIGGGCQVGPITLNVDSGDATGVAYDMTTGTATLGDSNFGVPGSSGCGFLAGIIDGQLGLPSAAGSNNLTLAVSISPILIGS
jgi:hypothetical protein